jgi:hypothetical protein
MISGRRLCRWRRAASGDPGRDTPVGCFTAASGAVLFSPRVVQTFHVVLPTIRETFPISLNPCNYWRSRDRCPLETFRR